MLGHYSVFKQQLFVCHIQIKLEINFDLKNWVDETAVDEIGVDETAVGKTGVDEPGRYLGVPAKSLHFMKSQT